MNHVCEDEAIETSTGPRPSGLLTITVECGVCGHRLDSYVDSVL